MVESTAPIDFRKHDIAVHVRKPINEVNQGEDSPVFAKGPFMFSNEHVVNDDANAIVRDLDGRIATSEPRRYGVSVRLIDD
jgi:hypothetical protein